MGLETSPLKPEVDAILAESNTQQIYGWRVEFKANDQIVKPLRTLNLDINREYDLNYTDEVVVEILIGMGTFITDLLPYRKDIVATLYKEPLNAISGQELESADVESVQLTATLIDNEDIVKVSKTRLTQDKETADLAALMNVRFQLTDPIIGQARMTTVGGVYRKSSSYDVLRFLMTTVLKNIQDDDSVRIKGVEMYPASSKEDQANIVIPPMNLVELPDYLHERVAGIYNAGLGHYIQKTAWYIYPLFDVTRYENDVKGLTIINIEKNKLPTAEKTYRTTANQVIVLSTNGAKHIDDSETKQLNDGNGVRFVNADTLFNGAVQTTGNKALALRKDNTSEFITQERKNGYNNLRMSDKRLTNNKFLELSKLARRQGSFLIVTWDNSDPDLLFPGMATKYMYEENGEIKELHGVLHGAHTYAQPATPVMTTRRHYSTTLLKLFIENADEETSDE